jgi:predicted ABC-type ATPase
MPHIIVIAGPNGAGKTTTAPVLLDETLHVTDFVNADTIAQGLCAFQPEKVAIQAGKTMLKRIHHLAEEGADFAFETTLASRTFAPWIARLKENGYFFHLVFLWLKSADLSVSRVVERVKMGGHSVPEETIRRRYRAGLNNFFNLYNPIADSWQFYDNSNRNELTLIAAKANNQSIMIEKVDIWQQLLGSYNER